MTGWVQTNFDAIYLNALTIWHRFNFGTITKAVLQDLLAGSGTKILDRSPSCMVRVSVSDNCLVYRTPGVHVHVSDLAVKSFVGRKDQIAHIYLIARHEEMTFR